jgi:hypothetical protein
LKLRTRCWSILQLVMMVGFPRVVQASQQAAPTAGGSLQLTGLLVGFACGALLLIAFASGGTAAPSATRDVPPARPRREPPAAGRVQYFRSLHAHFHNS